jgi:hypothetical protein
MEESQRLARVAVTPSDCEMQTWRERLGCAFWRNGSGVPEFWISRRLALEPLEDHLLVDVVQVVCHDAAAGRKARAPRCWESRSLLIEPLQPSQRLGFLSGVRVRAAAGHEGGLGPTHGLADELQAVSVLEQAVENGVGHGGVAEGLVPVSNQKLAGDDGGADLGAVLDDLEKVGGLVGAERPEQEVVEKEHLDPRPAHEQPGQATVSAGDGELVEHPGAAQVERGASVADDGVSERAGEVRLSDAGLANDQEVVVVGDPMGLGQVQDLSAVEATRAPEVDVLDHRDAA